MSDGDLATLRKCAQRQGTDMSKLVRKLIVLESNSLSRNADEENGNRGAVVDSEAQHAAALA